MSSEERFLCFVSSKPFAFGVDGREGPVPRRSNEKESKERPIKRLGLILDSLCFYLDKANMDSTSSSLFLLWLQKRRRKTATGNSFHDGGQCDRAYEACASFVVPYLEILTYYYPSCA